jgi:hypothetical protein
MDAVEAKSSSGYGKPPWIFRGRLVCQMCNYLFIAILSMFGLVVCLVKSHVLHFNCENKIK